MVICSIGKMWLFWKIISWKMFLLFKKSSSKHVVSCIQCFVDDLLIIPAASGAQNLKYSYSLWNQKLPFLKRNWAVFSSPIIYTSWYFLFYDFIYLLRKYKMLIILFYHGYRKSTEILFYSIRPYQTKTTLKSQVYWSTIPNYK